MLHNAFKQEVHATYPRDHAIWRLLRDGIPVAEAAKLCGIEGSSFEDGLFVNKGFIVIGRPLPRDWSKPLDLRVGDQCIYNHDGDYRLLRVVETLD